MGEGIGEVRKGEEIKRDKEEREKAGKKGRDRVKNYSLPYLPYPFFSHSTISPRQKI